MAMPAFTATLATCGSVSSFGGASLCTVRAPALEPSALLSRRSRVHMAAPHVIEQKQELINQVKDRLSTAQMIFQVPLPGLTVGKRDEFKKELPEGTSAFAVKNKLMLRAIADSGWEVAGPILKNSNIWVFVDDDIKGSVEAYKKFAKENNREPVLGGVMEGTFYDTDGITTIAALPSKIELITNVARLVKQIPTKLATSINMVPTNVGRAIKLAVADEGEGDDAALAEASE